MCTVRHLTISLALAATVTGALADEGLSRAQVRAEALAAQRAGEIPQGDLDIKPAVAHPDLQSPEALVVAKTRAQVRQELAQAMRLGDIPQGEEGRTPAELFPQHYAAARIAEEATNRRYASN